MKHRKTSDFSLSEQVHYCQSLLACLGFVFNDNRDRSVAIFADDVKTS